MLVVLIRSDNTADVAVTVPLRLGTARPKPPRLEENLGPCLEIAAEQIEDIASGNLRPNELERAKENLKAVDGVRMTRREDLQP